MIIIICLPVILIITIVLFIVNDRKPFFIQPRPGLNGKIFNLYKFKTMTDMTDYNGNLFPDAKRLTPTGNLLRKTSLDELPQFFNVLKGDMAIVGPRPLAVQYLPFYSEEEYRRHLVKPGITGLAQINGRNGLNWESKFAYDIQYVNRISLILDIKIIFMTVIKVLKREKIGIRGIDSPEDFDKYRSREI